MIIVIDTGTYDMLRFHLVSFSETKVVAFEMRNKDLLKGFDALLTQEHLTLDDVEGIGVLMNKGSFTGTRLAVTFANTMLFAKNIPVFSLQHEEIPSYELLTQLFQKTYLHAEYSGEPNINL